MRRIVLFFACIAVLAVSCVHEEAPQEPRTSYVLSGLTLSDEMQEATRSVFTGDDGQITSITLFAFDSDGNIMVYGDDAGSAYAGKRIEQYAEEGGEIEWLLPISEEPYDIYAVANLGDFRGRFATVDELVSSPDMEWSSELLSSSSDVGIPMRAILEGVTGGQDYTLPMRRVVARFDLTLRNFDSGRLIWFDICNVNATVNVFGVNECADADDMADLHEYATEQDIETLNAGGTVSFYVPENMQTTAGNYSLTGNKEWKETALELVNKYGLSQASDAECTYVRITLKRDSEEFPSEYFLYLGDGRNNFDVERGKKKNITANVGDIITVDDDDVTKISISDGFHEAGEFYAASRVRADIQFSFAEAPAWSEGFTVQSKDSNGNDIIRWDTPVKTGDNSYEVSGVCSRIGNNISIDFVNALGRPSSIATVSVKKPGVRVTSNGGFFAGNSVVLWNEASAPSVDINGREKYLYVYLVDEQGRNLNQGYGIDPDLVAFSYLLLNKDRTRTLSNVSFAKNSTMPTGSYIAKAVHSVTNTGSDAYTNNLLTLMAGELESVLLIRENRIGIEYSMDHSIFIPEIVVSLGTSLNYATTSYMYYQIQNPSKLPFDITSLTLQSANRRDYTLSDDVNYEGMRVGRLILPSDITSWTSSDVLFLKRNDVRSFSLEGGQTIEESDGIYYLPVGQDAMSAIQSRIEKFHFPIFNKMSDFNHKAQYHVLDISMKYHDSSCADKVSFKFNSAPKVSANDLALWGTDGLNDMGLTSFLCHDDQQMVNDSEYGTYFGRFGSMMNTSALEVIEDGVVDVDFSFNDQHQLVAVASEPVTLQVEMTGKIYSHIRCLNYNDLYPITGCRYITNVKGFSYNTDLNNGVTVSTTSTIIDSGVILNAFNEIRNNVYYSVQDAAASDNWHFEGSGTLSADYREYLKPYKLEISFNITSDRAISVTLPDELYYDYKKEPAVYWEGAYRQPSADTSRHSNCDECGGGDAYKEEIVVLKVNSLQPESISSSSTVEYDALASWLNPVFTISNKR